MGVAALVLEMEGVELAELTLLVAAMRELEADILKTVEEEVPCGIARGLAVNALSKKGVMVARYMTS